MFWKTYHVNIQGGLFKRSLDKGLESRGLNRASVYNVI